MKWSELIRVRSSVTTLQDVTPWLTQQVNALQSAEAFLLQHALYDGDLAVVVVWRNNDTPRKTREGLLIAQRLQRLGSVDHAVWIPTHDPITHDPHTPNSL